MSDQEFKSDLEKLAWHIKGTCKTVLAACAELGIEEIDDAEDKLLDFSVECCVGCDWWHDSYMLEFVEEKNGCLCDDCLRDYTKESES